jgi:hypothetical protein
MTTNTEVSGYSDTFLEYLKTCKGEVKSKSTEGYYHVDIVADAYNAGFEDGKKSSDTDFLKELINNELEAFSIKAQQSYILSKNLIDFIKEKGYKADGLYIRLTYNRPCSVIVSVKEDNLNQDIFVKEVYTKLHEFQNVFRKLYNESFDISLVASDNLCVELLKEDGFGYNENYN